MARDHRLIIEMPYLPKSWRRYPGTQRRFKPQDIRDWQEEVADRFREEMELQDITEPFEHVWVEIAVSVTTMKELEHLGDPDNIEKALFDAMTGVVIKDDKMSNIVDHHTYAKFADRPNTRITVMSLPPQYSSS